MNANICQMERERNMYFLSYQDEYLENFVRRSIVSMVEAILMNLELTLVQEQSHYSSIFLTFCKNTSISQITETAAPDWFHTNCLGFIKLLTIETGSLVLESNDAWSEYTIPRQEYDNADDITMFHWDAVPLSPSCHQSCLSLSGDMRPKSGHNTHTDPAGPRHPTPSVESDVSSLELETNLREDWSFTQRRPLLVLFLVESTH